MGKKREGRKALDPVTARSVLRANNLVTRDELDEAVRIARRMADEDAERAYRRGVADGSKPEIEQGRVTALDFANRSLGHEVRTSTITARAEQFRKFLDGSLAFEPPEGSP